MRLRMLDQEEAEIEEEMKERDRISSEGVGGRGYGDCIEDCKGEEGYVT